MLRTISDWTILHQVKARLAGFELEEETAT